MENASKALIIAGAILLSILIIAIGMFIYNSAQSTVNNSLTTMTTQEIDAFNNQFVSYEQRQSGSNVKALIGRLIANSNTYVDECAKVPEVQYNANSDSASGNNVTGIQNADGNNSGYVANLSRLRNFIVNKHDYWVSFDYGASGVIVKVTIDYDHANL